MIFFTFINCFLFLSLRLQRKNAGCTVVGRRPLQERKKVLLRATCFTVRKKQKQKQNRPNEQKTKQKNIKQNKTKQKRLF